MKYRIERSVTIAAPPERVWNTMQDVERRLEWDARIKSATLLTPQPMSKGAHTLLIYRMYGMTMQMQAEMIVWQPPFKSAVKVTIAGAADTVAGSWNLTANADGSTTWTTKLMLKTDGRWARLRSFVLGRSTERLTIISMHNLQRLIEAEYRSDVAQPEYSVA